MEHLEERLAPATDLVLLSDYRYGGGGSSAFATDVVADSAGNTYVTGSFTGTVDFDPGAGVANRTSNPTTSADAFLAKYSPAGDLLYVHRIGGTSSEGGASLAIDAADNVYVTGSFQGTVDFDPGAGTTNLTSATANLPDAFLLKLSAAGEFVYARRFGAAGQDEGTAVAVDAAGNVAVVGNFFGTVDFDPGAGTANLTSASTNLFDAFVVRLDTAGNFVFAHRLGGSSEDEAAGVAVDPAGNTYFVGTFRNTASFDAGLGATTLTSAGDTDVFVVGLNPAGQLTFAHRFGGTSVEEGSGIALDAAGNVYFTGLFNSTVDFDPGTGVASLSPTDGSAYLVRLNAAGAFGYARQYGQGGGAFATALAVDAATGNIGLSGLFVGTSDFDPGSGSFPLAANGESDLFVALLNANGDLRAANRLQSSTNEFRTGIAFDPQGNLAVSGVHGFAPSLSLVARFAVPAVSVSADDPEAAEPFAQTAANPGRFVVRLNGTLSQNLTVAYTLAGTATNGADYTALSGSVVIPAGSTSVVIDVAPLVDQAVENNETVLLTLTASTDYVLGATTSATVAIADAPPNVSITAEDPVAAEHFPQTPTDPARFVVHLDRAVPQELTVSYTLAGTAANGTDYATLSRSLVIPAGAASGVIDITPLLDQALENPETVVLTLTAGNGYQLGTSITAAAVITDAVISAELRADTLILGTQSLVIHGTERADTVSITPFGSSGTSFLVTLTTGPSLLFHNVTGRIQVFGHGGDDTITLSSSVRKQAVLDGGAGNDQIGGGRGKDTLSGGPGDDLLDGGAGIDRLVESGDGDMVLVSGTSNSNGSLTGVLGNDVLVRNTIETARLTGGASANRLDATRFVLGNVTLIGGAGDDVLLGGARNDILLGGAGADILGGGLGRDLLSGGLDRDQLDGGAGDDILIGGRTSHDDDLAALDALMREWTRPDVSYRVRINHLLGATTGSLSNGIVLSLTTVFDDGAANTLTGGLNLDWWFQGGADELTDRNLGTETVTRLS